MSQALETLFNDLKDAPRLLIEAELRPVQGERFQPTGFPDLGAATYNLADKTAMLLVESAQSMANRLEEACWDKANNELVPSLKGLQYVRVDLGDGLYTSSIREAHRLNSIYILSDSGIKQKLLSGMKQYESGTLELKSLAASVFQLDPCSLLHGIFFARKDIAGGRARLQRLLSGFIEAREVREAVSGGVKNETIDPSGVDAYARYADLQVSAEEKEGIKKALDAAKNIPYARKHYTSPDIKAYFNLDLATLTGYGLSDAQKRLLIALALFKIYSFLEGNLRLRTECNFDLHKITVTRPANLSIAALAEIKEALPALIKACEFGETPITVQAPRISKDALEKAKKRMKSGEEEGGSTSQPVGEEA